MTSQVSPRALAVVLAGFTAFLNLYATQPLLPLLMGTFEATHLAVSLTVTAPTIAVALAAPAVGRLADLVGRKRVIVASAVALATATVLAATSATLDQLVAWRFVQGLATPGVFAIAVAYIHDEWPPARVGRATAQYISANVVGGFCGRVLSGLVASASGWRMAFLVLAGINVAAAAAIWRWLPSSRVRRPASAPDASPVLAPILGNPSLLATFLVGLGVLFTQVATFTYVTFHLSAEPYRLGTSALGWLFVVYLIGAAVTPAAGRWVEQHGHRATLTAGMVVSAAGALLTLAAPLAAIVGGLALLATGVFVAQATASSYIGTATTYGRGLAVGIYASCYYTGGSLGAAVPGLLWDRGGWPMAVALVLAVQAAIVALARLAWREEPAAPGAS